MLVFVFTLPFCLLFFGLFFSTVLKQYRYRHTGVLLDAKVVAYNKRYRSIRSVLFFYYKG